MIGKVSYGGVTTPTGFRASAANGNIKGKNLERDDCGLIFSDAPCVFAGVFTSNVVKAAPVLYDMEIMEKGGNVMAVLANSGNANACTGAAGLKACQDIAAAYADALDIKADNIYSIAFSTMPFMTIESCSVLFFDKSGGLIFSVYAGRQNRQIIESVKTSFYKMKEGFALEKSLDRKSLVVYSSLTGNTKKVAEAVKSVIPNCDICSIDNLPENIDEYYFLAIGYWVDRGLPDAKSKKFINSIKNMNIGLFGTLGAYPDSPHAKGCIRDSENMLKISGKNNNVLGSFLCLGKIDEKLLDYMGKFMGDSHPMTPERKERLLEAQTHPDNNDLEMAKNVFAGFVNRLGL